MTTYDYVTDHAQTDTLDGYNSGDQINFKDLNGGLVDFDFEKSGDNVVLSTDVEFYATVYISPNGEAKPYVSDNGTHYEMETGLYTAHLAYVNTGASAGHYMWKVDTKYGTVGDEDRYCFFGIDGSSYHFDEQTGEVTSIEPDTFSGLTYEFKNFYEVVNGGEAIDVTKGYYDVVKDVDGWETLWAAHEKLYNAEQNDITVTIKDYATDEKEDTDIYVNGNETTGTNLAVQTYGVIADGNYAASWLKEDILVADDAVISAKYAGDSVFFQDLNGDAIEYTATKVGDDVKLSTNISYYATVYISPTDEAKPYVSDNGTHYEMQEGLYTAHLAYVNTGAAAGHYMWKVDTKYGTVGDEDRYCFFGIGGDSFNFDAEGNITIDPDTFSGLTYEFKNFYEVVNGGEAIDVTKGYYDVVKDVNSWETLYAAHQGLYESQGDLTATLDKYATDAYAGESVLANGTDDLKDAEYDVEMTTTSYTGSWLKENITGTAGDDEIAGGVGNDTISGKAGADVINGGAGNDIIRGGESNDTIDGGADADTFMYEANGTSFGHDTIKNATLDDKISFSTIKSQIGFGPDGMQATVTSTAHFEDLVFEKSGNDLMIKIKDNTADDIKVEGFFTAESKIDKIEAAVDGVYSIADFKAGKYMKEYLIKNDAVINVTVAEGEIHKATGYKENITLANGTTTVEFDLGSGSDTITLQEGQKLILKYNDMDTDRKTQNPNFKLDGTTLIMTRTVEVGKYDVLTIENYLTYGEGNVFYGSTDLKLEDTMWANAEFKDENSVFGYSSSSPIKPQAGDPFVGSFLSENIAGCASLESHNISGGGGNDLIKGSYGNDILNGDAGRDKIYGGNGVDTIHGGEGDDILIGESGEDLLYGDAGADQLFGGKDNDTLTGGEGNDTFVFNAGDGSDKITDAEEGDIIKFNNKTFSELGFIKNGDDLEIAYGTNDTVVVNDFFKGQNVDAILTSDSETSHSIKDDALINVVLTNGEAFDASLGGYNYAISGNGSVTNLDDDDKLVTSGETVEYMRENDGGLIVWSGNGALQTDKITVTDFNFDGEHDINVNNGTTENMILNVDLDGTLDTKGGYAATPYAEIFCGVGSVTDFDNSIDGVESDGSPVLIRRNNSADLNVDGITIKNFDFSTSNSFKIFNGNTYTQSTDYPINVTLYDVGGEPTEYQSTGYKEYIEGKGIVNLSGDHPFDLSQDAVYVDGWSDIHYTREDNWDLHVVQGDKTDITVKGFDFAGGTDFNVTDGETTELTTNITIDVTLTGILGAPYISASGYAERITSTASTAIRFYPEGQYTGKDTLVFAENAELSYSRDGNDLVIANGDVVTTVLDYYTSGDMSERGQFYNVSVKVGNLLPITLDKVEKVTYIEGVSYFDSGNWDTDRNETIELTKGLTTGTELNPTINPAKLSADTEGRVAPNTQDGKYHFTSYRTGEPTDVTIDGAYALARDGEDTVYGTEKSDWIHGGAGNDTIYGGTAGHDMLAGGDEAVAGTDGVNTIYAAGVVDNELVYNKDGVEIYGGKNKDTIYAGGLYSETVNYIWAHGGDDEIHLYGGKNTIMLIEEGENAKAGNDAIYGATSVDTLKFVSRGGQGQVLAGYNFNQLTFAKSDVDLTITVPDGSVTTLKDFFSAYPAKVDTILTADRVEAHSIKSDAVFNIVLADGETFDKSTSGYGDYIVSISGEGKVKNLGEADMIAMSGTTEYSFNDKGLLVEDGTNEITIIDNTTGQTANVYVNGDADDITGKTLTVTKLTEFDATNLGYKNVEITGTGSADNFTGSTGDDTIYGKAGADVINGGAGKDEIQGGAGDDTIDGGTGADTFMYEANGTSFGHDTIKNATLDDKISFSTIKSQIGFGPDGMQATVTSTAHFEDLVFEKSGNDLMIKIKDNTADDIKVEGFFTAGSKIDKIEAAVDGVYSIADFKAGKYMKEYSIKNNATINVVLTPGSYTATGYNENLIVKEGTTGQIVINKASDADGITIEGKTFNELNFIAHRDGRLDIQYNGATDANLILLAGYDASASKLTKITTDDGTYNIIYGTDSSTFEFSTESKGNNIIIGALGGDKLNFTDIDASKVLYTRNAYGDLVVTVKDQADFAVTLKGFFSADVHKSAHLDTIKFNDSDDDVSILKDAEINVNADSYFLGYNVVNDTATAEVGGYNEIIDVTSGNLSTIDINDAVLEAISSGDITKTLDETGYHYTLALGKDKELASIIVGQLGDDTIIDSEGNDYLAGANGDDEIYSSKGEDALIGGAGDDNLYAKDNTSDVEIYGGAGDDEITSGSGNDFIWGGAGDDDIILSGGNNRIILSDDNFGSDTIYGATANDKLEFVLRQDGEVVQGHNFDELTFVRNNADLEIFVGNNSKATIKGFFTAESPVDTIIAKDGTYSIKETEINVVLTDGETFDASGDYKYAISGNGFVKGLDKDKDIIKFSGTPTYTLIEIDGPAGPSANLKITCGDNESITVLDDYSLGKEPVVYGGSTLVEIAKQTLNVEGLSTFNASGENFKFLNVNITGTAGDDEYKGSAGNDTISGGDGNDVIYGGAGNDDLTGGKGENNIYTGYGDDVVDATTGANIIIVDGAGTKTITSGSNEGNNFRMEKGSAVIKGATSKDSIEFATFDPTKFNFAKSGTSLKISSAVEGDTDTITIENYYNQDGSVNPNTINTFILGETETTLNLEWKKSNVDGEYHMYNVITGDDEDVEIPAIKGIRNWIDAGPNDNTVTGGDKIDMLAGNDGADVITASNPAEIFGGAGADEIYALGGDSFVAGGLGDDTITVSGGNNTIAFVDTTRGVSAKDFGMDVVEGAKAGDVLKFSVDYGDTIQATDGYTFSELSVEKDGVDLIVMAGEEKANRVTLTDYFTQKEEDRVSAIQALVKDDSTGVYTQVREDDALTVLVNNQIYTPSKTYDEEKLEENNGSVVINKTDEGTYKVNATEYVSPSAKGITVNNKSANAGLDITGSAFNDTITSKGNESNTIVENGGTNKITTGNAADVVIASNYSSNTINVGAGENTVTLESTGTNKVTASNGDNNINVYAGSNTVKLGNGANEIGIAGGVNTVKTGKGANTVLITDGVNKVTTGKGKDGIIIAGGNNNISSGTGDDVYGIVDGYNTIKTGNAKSTFTISDSYDITDGDVVVSTVYGDGGVNVITSGSKDDTFNIDAGVNTIKSGSGVDTFNLNGGKKNIVDAGAGKDEFDIKAGYNYLNGAADNDTYKVNLKTVADGGFDFSAGDILITDTKGKNVLDAIVDTDTTSGKLDTLNVFFDVAVKTNKSGTKFKGATYSNMVFSTDDGANITTGDDTKGFDEIVGIDVSSKKAFTTINTSNGATGEDALSHSATISTKQLDKLASDVAGWLFNKGYASTDDVFANEKTDGDIEALVAKYTTFSANDYKM